MVCWTTLLSWKMYPSSTAPEGIVYTKLRTSDITGMSLLQKRYNLPFPESHVEMEPGKHS